ncbi:MAG: HAD family phosphatase [Candidatus Aenigmarchaeota archaeon]|nr:HAD family phosphatase [Candidatus Aenigmarchaeota archaeon]MCK5177315.1 HAD family phosphatase [Candidatus Aenigmarchaeota archaeon]
MIKAIIFDFGGVVEKFDNDIFLEKISKFSDKGVEELNELIYVSSDLPRKYEMGLISSGEFFRKISEMCNLSLSKQEFIEAYTDIFCPIQTTHRLIKKLKNKYKISLLSNTSHWDFEHGIKKSEVFSLFDFMTLSFEVGARKPEEKIYLDALDKLKLKPQECVFIDDVVEYVEGANKTGINGIHYTSYDKLLDCLKKLDVDF